MPTTQTASTTRAREAIEPLVRELGGRVVERVRLGEGSTRTVLDLVVVDRYGCLVIALEVWPGARILGGSRAESWAAESATGSQLFENPFARATAQADALALEFAGRSPLVDRAHVSTLVAFDVGSLEHVKVTEQQRYRMVGFDGLASAISDRHDFAINSGVLDAAGVASVAQLLEGMSASGAQQQAVTADQSPVTAVLPGYRPSTDFAPEPVRSSSRPTRAMYPPPQPLGGSEMRASRVRRLRVNVSLFVALALAGAAVWMFYYGGLNHVVGSLTGSVSGLQGRYTSEVQAGPKGVSATPEQALTALKDGAPDVADALIDPGHPELAPSGEYTIYVWTYHPHGAPAGQTGRVRVIFDAGGVLRGIEPGQ